MTAADELRQAAAKVRETASAALEEFLTATPADYITFLGPGHVDGPNGLPFGVMVWTRLMHPGLAEPLAAWLEDTADTHQKHEADGANWCRYCAETWPCGDTKHAREVARAITGGAS